MINIMTITLIGFTAGVLGTGLGGLLAIILGKPSERLLSFILGFSAGIMLTIVCFDLLPEAFEIGDFIVSILGIIAGVIMIIVIDEGLHGYKGTGTDSNRNLVKMGLLIGLGVAMHNFPEGLAIGSGFMARQELGIGIAIVIALHNIPEGISMAAPMRVGGLSRFSSLLYTMLVGLPMGLGAYIGAMLGEISQVLISFCLAFAGGTMLYITCGELIPSSNRIHRGKSTNIGLIIGFIIGLMITR